MYKNLLSQPWIALTSFLILTVVVSSFLPALELHMDISSHRDLGIQSAKDLDEIKMHFGRAETVSLIVQTESALSVEQQCEISKTLQEMQNSSSYVRYIMHPWKVPGFFFEQERLIFLSLYPDPCDKTPHGLKVRPLLAELDDWKSDNAIKSTVHFSVPENTNPALLMSAHLKPLELELRSKLPDLEFMVLGPSSYRYHLFLSVLEDSWASIVGGLLLLTLLGLYFGSLSASLVFASLLGLSFVWVLGASAALGLPMSFLVNGMFLILIISSLSDFVFICMGLRENSHAIQVFESLSRPSGLTSMTTVIGFLSLNVSDFSLIRDFGTQAAIGAIVQWCLCFLVLPNLLVLAPGLLSVRQPPRFMKWITGFILRVSLPPVFGRVLIAPCVLGILAFPFLTYMDEPLQNFPAEHELSRGINSQLNKTRAKTTVRMFVPATAEEPERVDLFNQLNSRAEVSDILNYDRVWSQDFHSLSAADRAFVEREFRMTGALKHLKTLKGNEQWVLFLKEYSTDVILNLRNLVERVCSSCLLSGPAAVYAESSQFVAKSLISTFWLSLSLVGLVILWLCRKRPIRQIALILYSIFFGPLVMVLVLALFSVPVNIVTCLFFAALVGITGDNFIQYFVTPYLELAQGIESKAEASALTAICLVLISCVFLFYSLVPLKLLGLLFVIGFAVNFFGDYLVLKAGVSGDAKR